MVLEYRGKVFSDGGDSEEYTLANFLKTYSKNIKGSPSGVTLPLGKCTYLLELAMWRGARSFWHMSMVISPFLISCCLHSDECRLAQGKKLNAAVRTRL